MPHEKIQLSTREPNGLHSQLISGTEDPNVHFQNTEVFANPLIEAKKQFTFMPYRNRPHGPRWSGF